MQAALGPADYDIGDPADTAGGLSSVSLSGDRASSIPDPPGGSDQQRGDSEAGQCPATAARRGEGQQ